MPRRHLWGGLFVPRALVLGSAVIIAAWPAPAVAQVAKLHPLDEASRDPSFVTFRARLLRAVRTQDTALVLGSLAPNILNSFGGDGGIAEFRQRWRLASGRSELWATLEDILVHGGSFVSDTLFAAPYWSGPRASGFDPFAHWVVIGSRVRVRTAAAGADIIAELSYDVVRAEAPRTAWTVVHLEDGRDGFIASRYLRSAIGYRAGFVKRGGRWYLRSLVAGD